MGDKPTRREFIITTSSAALAAAVPPTAVTASTVASENEVPAREQALYSSDELFQTGPQRTFSGDKATQIAMPIGGIGAGCVCLNGYGGLQDFSIGNRPATTALPEGFAPSQAAFAILRIKGDPSITKLVEGPFPVLKIYDQGLQGEGYRRGGFEGFPRFQKCVFQGEYPFGEAKISDSSVPLQVTVTGWNPFIPLDDKDSGIPCAILEYTFHNSSSRRVEYEFSYHLSHLAPGCGNDGSNGRNTVIAGQGVFLHNVEHPNTEGYGSACLMAIGYKPRIKGMWLRSPGWEFDSLSALWREVSMGTFTTNEGSNGIDTGGRNGASILLEGSLPPGASRIYPILVTWHFPNCYQQVGGDKVAASGDQGAPGCRSLAEGTPPPWRPYYATVWKDAREVALYVSENYSTLRSRTLAFKDALFSSTLPPYVLDAVSANLAILKSPTVLRLENGDIWGWEGCFPDGGCCHGSCTHVWNYAQAFPHLYPRLERTLRELELGRSMDENGHVTFRSALPEGPVKHDFHAASDGQLGGIMKVFRDWQISGDSDWLKKMYPLAKCSLDYCIRTWDPDHRGALFEPHHNTYDIEFWGPDGMCTSIYLGALSAFSAMARATGQSADAEFYEALAQRCARFMDEELFNGEYYQQKVQYEGLRNDSFVRMVAQVDERSGEMQRLLKKEGPKYQYGSGCISDGVIGCWMAHAYGVDTPLSRDHVHSTLQAIFKHNFKTDLAQHANAQRPGYAMGHEPGLLLCSWPNGGKPTLPFVYSDEVWTGIEYQVASHLIAEGFVKEGLTIVRALRNRYDGRARNPWNEYECGNYYARAMASYALLGALAGFRYSAAQRTLWFGPATQVRPFKTFFSTASGFGSVVLDQSSVQIQMIEGELSVDKLVLADKTGPRTLDWKTTVRPDSPSTKDI
ncbi:MAG TPA: GH116 family glycosyl hydrolase [Candidatus Sulfotelmatobacter sp.]|nr:GH116 family glycosyl hydrolase [Candidatus Sulfotelmatobacter sp.]